MATEFNYATYLNDTKDLFVDFLLDKEESLHSVNTLISIGNKHKRQDNSGISLIDLIINPINRVFSGANEKTLEEYPLHIVFGFKVPNYTDGYTQFISDICNNKKAGELSFNINIHTDGDQSKSPEKTGQVTISGCSSYKIESTDSMTILIGLAESMSSKLGTKAFTTALPGSLFQIAK